MKKLLAFILAAVMAFSPLAGALTDSVTAYADPAALTYGTDVPAFSTTAIRRNSTPYDTGLGHREILFDTWSNTINGEIDTYKTTLAGNGFTLRGTENTAGGNRMFTYYKSNGAGGYTVVHCNYFAALSEFRINYGTETFIGAASVAEAGATGSIEPTISAIGMSDDVLCEVVQLSDGSFIIIDGGWGTDANKSVEYIDLDGNTVTRTYTRSGADDIEALLDFLEAKTPSGTKPRVTWMYSHGDPDHVTLSKKVINDYSDKFDLNMVIYNFPTIDAINEIGFTNGKTGDDIATEITNFAGYQSSLLSAINTNFPEAEHFIYHTGQKLYFPGCEIEFIFAQEDYRPNSMPYLNNAAGAWRMTFTDSGKTALFLTDCDTALNSQINSVFGSYLKSDILQVAHHGSNGGYKALYQNVDPTVCFWPCTDFAFYNYLKHQGGTAENHVVGGTNYDFNYWLRNESDVTTHITASATHTLIVSTLTEDLGGNSLVHQGMHAGFKGNGVTYLSDLERSDTPGEKTIFFMDSPYQGDGTKIYPYYMWNSSHTVNAVNPVNHPTGRELTTMAEGTRTFMPLDIVLGYTGKYFSKGLGGHLSSSCVDTSSIVYDISGQDGTMFYAVAGLTGDAANRPTSQQAAQSYGVTFRVYGSNANAYSPTMSFTLLSEQDEIGGYGASVAASKTYNNAEFNVNVSGWKFIKLEAVADGSASGGSYAWGGACLYTPLAKTSTIGASGAAAGKDALASEAKTTYLSDIHNTERRISSFIIGTSSSLTAPRDFKLDTNWDNQLFVWTGSSQTGSTARKQVTSANSPRTLTVTEADSTTHDVDYTNTEIAIGYRGTKYAKGLAGLVSASTVKSAEAIYDVQGLNAKYFYSVVGMTGAANTNPATGNYTYKLTFDVYGSKTGTANGDFELLAYASGVRAYLIAEFNVDITGYKYLKLVTTSDGGNSGGSFVWADACVYGLADKLSNKGAVGTFAGHSEADSITYLSDVYSTNMVDSFIIGTGASEANPREFKLDTNWDDKVYVWTGKNQNGSDSRKVVDNTNSPRTLTITAADSTTSDVVYDKADIAVGYRGTKFAKGLGGLVSASTNKSAYVVYDIRDLDAEYFYAVAGITGEGNVNPATDKFNYKLTFTVYGSKAATYDSDSFSPIAYAKDVRAYLTAEFKLDVSDYNFIKLETVSDGGNSGGSFVWADACVYSTTAPAIQNKLTGVAVTAGSDLTLHVTATTESEVTAPRVRFSGIDDPVVVNGVDADGVWTFEYDNIYSHNMSDTITIELLDDDSQVLETKTYSIKAYCDSVHTLGQTAEGLTQLGLTAQKFALLDTLMADMLEYGAAAQTYISYNTDGLANTSSWVTTSKTQSFTTPTTAFSTSSYAYSDMICGASLRLTNDVRFVLRVKAAEATKVVISTGLTSKTYLLSEAAVDNGYYIVVSDGLYATDFDTTFTITLEDASATYQTVTYSVSSYIASKAGSSDAALAAIVRAIRNYGASADAYAA